MGILEESCGNPFTYPSTRTKENDSESVEIMRDILPQVRTVTKERDIGGEKLRRTSELNNSVFFPITVGTFMVYPAYTAVHRRFCFIETQDGTILNDKIQAAAATGDGSVVLAGYTHGEWSGELTGEESDFAAVKLDANGTEVWRWQVIHYAAMENLSTFYCGCEF